MTGSPTRAAGVADRCSHRGPMHGRQLAPPGPTRNGVSTETGLTATWPKKGPPVAWEKDIGEGFSGPGAWATA